MNASATELQISVAWITPHIQDIVPLRVKPGTTVGQAIAASGLLAAYAIDATTLSIAVAGKRRAMDSPVADGERIDLLRPLTADAKEARRKRALRQRARQDS